MHLLYQLCSTVAQLKINPKLLSIESFSFYDTIAEKRPLEQGGLKSLGEIRQTLGSLREAVRMGTLFLQTNRPSFSWFYGQSNRDVLLATLDSLAFSRVIIVGGISKQFIQKIPQHVRNLCLVPATGITNPALQFIKSRSVNGVALTLYTKFEKFNYEEIKTLFEAIEECDVLEQFNFSSSLCSLSKMLPAFGAKSLRKMRLSFSGDT